MSSFTKQCIVRKDSYEKRGETDKKVDELRCMIKRDDLMKNIFDADYYLLRYLHSDDFDVEKAFQRMKGFYELFDKDPLAFPIVAPLDYKWIISKNVNIVYVGAHDREGRPIVVYNIGNMDPDAMEIVDLLAVSDILGEYFLNMPEVLTKGICGLVDIKGLRWKCIKWATPHNILTGLKRLETMPLKNYRVHLINSSLIVNAFLSIIIPFLPQYIRDVVYFHFNDWQSLHEHVDPCFLPPEYQGTKNYNINEMHEVVYKDNDRIFKNLQLYRTLNVQNVLNKLNEMDSTNL